MMEVSSVAKVEELGKEKGEQVEVEDEIELSLELSIGRKTYTKSNPLHDKSMDSSSSCPKIGGLDFTEDAQISVLPRSVVAHIVPATDQQSKREIQALRRQEARKKREEKLKIKTIPRGKKGNFCSVNGDKERRENHDDEEEDIVVLDEEEAEPPRKKEKNEKMVQNHEEEELVVKDVSLTLINNGSNSMGQMQYSYRPALQYVPFTNGFVYPYGVVPRWGPVAAGNGSGTGGNEGQEKEKRVNLGNNGGTEVPEKEKKVSFEPAAGRSFRPYNRNSEQNGNGKLDGSSGGSSSAVSDFQNSSLQGGNNSDTGSSSSKFQQENLNDLSAGHPQVGKSENNCDSNGMKSNEAEEKATTNHIANMVSSSIHQSSEAKCSEEQADHPLNQSITSTRYPIPPATLKEETTNGKPPIPQTEHHGTSSLPQMPCVSTTGNGPNGKTITGFLYRYTKTEVSIVCVCHGTSFSPAEFVEHAGGVDVAHPLRHITVIPSAFV